MSRPATETGGYRPLHYAAYQDRIEIIRLLLDKGADTSATTDKGETALELATHKGHAEAIKLLSSRTSAE